MHHFRDRTVLSKISNIIFSGLAIFVLRHREHDTVKRNDPLPPLRPPLLAVTSRCSNIHSNIHALPPLHHASWTSCCVCWARLCALAAARRSAPLCSRCDMCCTRDYVCATNALAAPCTVADVMCVACALVRPCPLQHPGVSPGSPHARTAQPESTQRSQLATLAAGLRVGSGFGSQQCSGQGGDGVSPCAPMSRRLCPGG